jgi:hypothetical protein
MMENNDNEEDINETDDDLDMAKDMPAKSADVVSLDTFRNKS